MGNYKPWGHDYRAIEIAGQQIEVAERFQYKNPFIKILYDEVQNSADADGFRDTEGNVIYICPTGNQLDVIGFYTRCNAADTTILIYQGDTENAISNLKMRWVMDNGQERFPSNFVITALKYVTYDPIGTGLETIFLYGIQHEV